MHSSAALQLVHPVPMPPFHSKSTGAQDGADQLRRCQRPHRVGRVGQSERPPGGGEDYGLGGASLHSPPAMMRAAS